jgi:hypothetical protein
MLSPVPSAVALRLLPSIAARISKNDLWRDMKKCCGRRKINDM